MGQQFQGHLFIQLPIGQFHRIQKRCHGVPGLVRARLAVEERVVNPGHHFLPIPRLEFLEGKARLAKSIDNMD